MQTGRVNLIEFYLTLAMKILIPRPCLLSSGMKGFFFLFSSSKYTFSRGCQVFRLQSFFNAAHQAAAGECVLALSWHLWA